MILLTEQFDEELKLMKKAMQTADCDTSVVRAWLKLYERVKRQTAITEESYKEAREHIAQVQECARELEQKIIDGTWDSDALQETKRNACAKLRRLQGSYEHEFLVSNENQEYQLTYQTILDLETKECDKIIFQSEVENLVALNQEILDRSTPNFYYLGFYETNRSAEDLSDLPYEEKMRKIGSLYEADFIHPIEKQLVIAIHYADSLLETPEQLNGWRGGRLRETFEFLWNKDGETKSAEERAKQILSVLE